MRRSRPAWWPAHLGLVGDTCTVLVSGRDTTGRYTLIDMHIRRTAGRRHDLEEMFTIFEAFVRGELSRQP